MSENGSDGSGSPASRVAQGASSASTAASGASQIADDPVGGATDIATGAAGIASAAGVQEAEAIGQGVEAAGTAVSAAQDLEHDPVGGLLGMAEAATGAVAATGVGQQATQAAQGAVGMAQGAASMIQGATGAAQSTAGAASSARESASSARAAPPRREAVREEPNEEEEEEASDSPSSGGAAGGGTVLNTTYEFECSASADWQVHRVTFEERLDQPYEVVIDLLHADRTTDAMELLGQSATFSFKRHESGRLVSGIIRRVERGTSGRGDRMLAARVHLVPALWMLSQTRNTRIFQEKTVPEILSEVLEAGLGHFQRRLQKDLSGTYRPREYCVQWEESDLQFCQRLMQEEGIWYRFEFDADPELLVLGDSASAFPALLGQFGSDVNYSPQHQGASNEAMVKFAAGNDVVPGKTVVRDYDWKRPDALFEGENVTGHSQEEALEEYFHGSHVNFAANGAEDAASKAQLNSRRRAAQHSRAHGQSDISPMIPGARFTLAEHNLEVLNIEWLVVSVSHRGAARVEGAEGAVEYINTVQCIPADVDWRPARDELKRRVHSVVTATVTGPPSEEIHTDEHGRIKVQFHWDREGQKNDRSSCWIRSMQSWAGPGWGTWFLPRIGMEVVVTFVDGDVDRPLVIGSVYNGKNPPPYSLPDDKTKSTIKTNSSPGGDGYNELRFEDAAGHEEIFIHAQKDMNTVVENNETLTVHANRTKTVDVNETMTIKGHQMITINGEGDPDPNSVKGGQMKITGKYNLYANDEIIVEAPNKITLKVPGSSIVMEPGKITLTSGDKSTIVLDANVLAKSSGNSSMFLDANANLHANGGGDVLLDANACVRSNAGSHVTLDGNALVHANAGAQANFTADAVVSGTNATLSGTTASTVSAPTATLQGGAGSVEAAAAGVSASGPTINIAGSGSTSISGAVVKIN